MTSRPEASRAAPRVLSCAFLFSTCGFESQRAVGSVEGDTHALKGTADSPKGLNMSVANELSSEVASVILSPHNETEDERGDLLKVMLLFHTTLRELSLAERRRHRSKLLGGRLLKTSRVIMPGAH